MMTSVRERLAERLQRFGMPFGEEQLAVAEELVASRGFVPDELSDVVLMTICVEAYGSPDHDRPAWV